jgi:hypothetical protein
MSGLVDAPEQGDRILPAHRAMAVLVELGLKNIIALVFFFSFLSDCIH